MKKTLATHLLLTDVILLFTLDKARYWYRMMQFSRYMRKAFKETVLERDDNDEID